jgi:hypothetical protein
MARLYLCVIALLLFACVPALAQNIIANPGFESGAFPPWTVTDQAAGSGSFFVNSGTTTSLSSHTTVGPSSGTFYAVSDQMGPGAHSLRQTFTIPAGAVRVILAFKMFVPTLTLQWLSTQRAWTIRPFPTSMAAWTS